MKGGRSPYANFCIYPMRIKQTLNHSNPNRNPITIHHAVTIILLHLAACPTHPDIFILGSAILSFSCTILYWGERICQQRMCGKAWTGILNKRGVGFALYAVQRKHCIKPRAGNRKDNLPNMGDANGWQGAAPSCALCPAPAAPSRREKKVYVPSRPFPSIVAA